ncbi:uncharacterized protein CDAR_474981 [Caerostris darwini]|uniref:Uncharacterized protein n=1 Tax=Caerostris darwini TaxID=1538125 RepID=A0AAV4QL72_9ARAC|nr:uncharacterized protein CDAR_474981 [Caerostris darwini]
MKGICAEVNCAESIRCSRTFSLVHLPIFDMNFPVSKSQANYPPDQSNSLTRQNSFKPFDFNYNILKKDGQTQNSRSESADGSGRVQGSYFLNNDEGHFREVLYQADKDGYKSIIRTNEPGTRSSNPASVFIEYTTEIGRKFKNMAKEAIAPLFNSVFGSSSDSGFAPRKRSAKPPPVEEPRINAHLAGPLETFEPPPVLNDEVQEILKPIYEDLTAGDLFERCLGIETQNNNESFNSCVWQLGPKHQFTGKNIVDVTIYCAACTFNEGFTAILNIMDVMDIKIGPQAKQLTRKHDESMQPIVRAPVTPKRPEKFGKKAKSEEAEEYERTEGILYCAGITD